MRASLDGPSGPFFFSGVVGAAPLRDQARNAREIAKEMAERLGANVFDDIDR